MPFAPPADPPASSRRDRLYVGLAGALMLVSALTAGTLLSAGAVHSNDFKHLWAGAWLLAHGGNPYDPAELMRVARLAGLGAINPYVYLPTTGMLLRPLAALPFREAVPVWFWVNWGLAWGLVWGMPRLLKLHRRGLCTLVGAAFMAASMPLLRQMTAGQMNVVAAWLLVLGAWGLRRSGRPGGAGEALTGVAVALGFAWKIAPIVLIPALLVLGRWRAALWAGAASVALLGLSIGLYGLELHREALALTSQMGYGESTWAGAGMDFYRDPFNQSVNALMHHLWTDNPYTTPWLRLGAGWANGLTLLVTGLLTLGWLWGVGRWHRRRPTGVADSLHSYGLIDLYFAATLLMLLAPSLMWDHYSVQALPALLWAVGRPGQPITLWRALLFGVCFAALVIPWHHPVFVQGISVPLMSLRLWPVLLIYGYLLQNPLVSLGQSSGYKPD